MSADLVVGDTGSIMRITCKNKSDGSIIDLTGATVYIAWRDEADTADLKPTMTIVGSPVNGLAEYKFIASDLYGNFMTFEFEIVDAGGEILTSLSTVKQIVRTPLVA